MSTTCEAVANLVGWSASIPVSDPKFTAMDEPKLLR
jgi:hypothetical protein